MTILLSYADRFSAEADVIDGALQKAVLDPPTDPAELARWKTQYGLFAQKASSLGTIASQLRDLDALGQLNGLEATLTNLEGATEHARLEISKISDINHQFDVLQKLVSVGLAIVTAVTTGGATAGGVVTAVTALLNAVQNPAKGEAGGHPAGSARSVQPRPKKG